MAEDVSIVMTLKDRVSEVLTSMTGKSKAFDKSLDDLERGLKQFESAQGQLTRKSTQLKQALEEANRQVTSARQEYKKLGDEASKGALDKAIEDQERLKQQLKETEGAIKTNNAAYRDMLNTARTAANRAGGSEESSLASGLKSAGLTKLIGDAATELGGTLIESALGQPTASFVSSLTSGIASGAALGAIAGPTGALIGAGVGALAGGVSGYSKIYAAKDDALKSYVQENVEGQLEAQDTMLTSGSALAAQRELDAIAFNKLLGEGTGSQYLEDLKKLAASTPLEYSGLTAMSRGLATGFGNDPQRMLTLMQRIGDAGSAVGLAAGDMETMAQSLSRMQSSGKASLEYLNIFQERGVDVIGMLSEALGKNQGQIYEMISKGQIGGQQAVSIIEEGLAGDKYAGSMDTMSKTYSGLSSTLEDNEADLQAMMGEGYNRGRSEGMEKQIAWMNEQSEDLGEAYAMIGQWKASLENLQEQYEREAMNAVMTGDTSGLFEGTDIEGRLQEMAKEYQEAQAAAQEGNQEAMAELGRLLAEAQVIAQNEYNASEGAQLAVESEKSLIQNVRDDSGLNNAYYDAGYSLGQEFSRGRAAGALEGISALMKPTGLTSSSTGAVYDEFGNQLSVPGKTMVGYGDKSGRKSSATGLERVPYNDFPALLHEGERVLTASEARTYNSGGGAAGGVTVTGNTFVVRQDSDIDAIAAQLLNKIREAGAAGVY